MNPYQAPKSELVVQPHDSPKSLPIIYALFAVSFFFVALESVVSTVMAGENIFDIENHIYVLLWLGLLVWFYRDITRRSYNPKWIILFLSVVSLCTAAFNYQGVATALLSVGEASCYIGAFALLQKSEYSQWFS